MEKFSVVFVKKFFLNFKILFTLFCFYLEKILSYNDILFFVSVFNARLSFAINIFKHDMYDHFEG